MEDELFATVSGHFCNRHTARTDAASGLLSRYRLRSPLDVLPADGDGIGEFAPETDRFRRIANRLREGVHS